jgi:glycerophosphoryl diester phosphodiesterase
MLIDDLGRLLQEIDCHPDAVLQLDLKEYSVRISEADVAVFAKAIAPVAKSVILSGGDAVAVERLSRAVPDMPVGYDPCHDGAIERLMENRDFAGFVAGALEASPKATMIYLHHKLVLFADAAGFDMIGAFHQAGRTIDAYTINRAIPDVLPDVRRLLALKADQITTDDPVGLETLIASGH